MGGKGPKLGQKTQIWISWKWGKNPKFGIRENGAKRPKMEQKNPNLGFIKMGQKDPKFGTCGNGAKRPKIGQKKPNLEFMKMGKKAQNWAKKPKSKFIKMGQKNPKWSQKTRNL